MLSFPRSWRYAPRFEFTPAAFHAAPGRELAPVPEICVALYRGDAPVTEQDVVQRAFLDVVKVWERQAGKEIECMSSERTRGPGDQLKPVEAVKRTYAVQPFGVSIRHADTMTTLPQGDEVLFVRAVQDDLCVLPGVAGGHASGHLQDELRTHPTPVLR